MKKTGNSKSDVVPVPAADAAAASVRLWKRLVCAFLAGIPFFCMLPYTVHSWISSPMDRMNWIFHLAFLLLAACAMPAMKDSVKELKTSGLRGDRMALLFIFASALLYGVGVMRQINMIRLLAGMCFWWAGVWFFFGWRGAWTALPAFVVLALGCTSSTFVLCNFFLISPQTALYLKLGVAILCAVLCTVVMLTDYVMKFEVLCWFFVAALILFCSEIIRAGDKTAPPFLPDPAASITGFTTREIPLSETTIRFFEGAEAHQYAITDGIIYCDILKVKCGNDIHKIHPASHCIRSGGAEILSESVTMHTLPDGRSLPVTEVISKFRGMNVLTFVWYTGPRETTGSFYTFRRKWSSSEQWFSYQAATEIYHGNKDAARRFLLDLLSKY